MYAAAKNHNLDVVKLFISKNNFPKNADGQTDLHIASLQDDVEVVNTLLECGMDVDLRNVDGLTPLMCAVSEEVAAMLVSKGASCEAKCLNGNTVLHIASERGLAEVVKFLLNHNMNVDIRGKKGCTALMQASNDKIALLLIKHKANLYLTDDEGRTALHAAAERGHIDVMEMLIGNGTPVDIITKDGLLRSW